MSADSAPAAAAPESRPEPGEPSVEHPIVMSVIVAAHNAETVLPVCLRALVNSDLPREQWELIVVDDGSTDSTALMAAEYADVVVRLPGRARGPAYARNRGAELSHGSLIMFCDADVRVDRDVLSRFVTFFGKMPGVSAAFGSYDADPPAPGMVSQFRNLLHHYVHQSNPGDAETFWSGCGAIRREALLDVEMFDEWHYSRPQIEDIDIGRRLRRAGHRIVLRPEIQCSHLKAWTLGSILRTDLGSRGVPWMRALLQEEVLAEFQSLNLRFKERFCTGLSLLATLCLLAGVVRGSPLMMGLALMMAGLIFLMNLRFYRFLWRARGFGQAAASVPLHFLFYLTAAVSAAAGYVAHVLFGEPSAPPEVEAEAAMNLSFWPPCPRRPGNHLWRPIRAVKKPVDV